MELYIRPSHNFYFEKCFFLIQWFIFKLSFIHRILCKLFSLCESSLQIFPIICHMSLSPFDWLIYWLHNYWDDYRRRHWRIWFIFINKVNNTTMATLSVTTWTDWCHLNSVLPRGRLPTTYALFRIGARANVHRWGDVAAIKYVRVLGNNTHRVQLLLHITTYLYDL